MNYRQVHLDFHTSEAIGSIGANFSKAQFQKALTLGHVNSITLFAKCHHGWAYYPAKTNTMHPGLTFDLLGAQIEAAHEIGVKTPVYLSVGADEHYVREHPEHRYEDKNHSFNNFSTAGYHVLCLNTPYLDHLLAQITEVLERYDVDGLFLDIVGVRPCCCSHCMKTLLSRGMDPNESADLLSLGEEVYANYLARVRDTVDRIAPGLPVFHNEGHVRIGRRDLIFANSHLEIESLPTGGWGYDHFPFSARYAQTLGLDYLGMTGKFHTSWGEFGGFKHPNALRYEVALSGALGAKCSVGDQLHPDGAMDLTTYELIGKAYQELEEKEPYLEGAAPVCDIALLSVEGYNNSQRIVSGGAALAPSDVGAGRILLEGKYQFAVVDTQADFSPYKVLVLPDVIVPSEELEKKLAAYVSGGGKILASGESCIRDNRFLFDFGARVVGNSAFKPSYIRPLFDNPHGSDYIMYGDKKVIEREDGIELAQGVAPYFNRTREHFSSHLQTPSSKQTEGSGIVLGRDGAYIAWKIFEDYAQKGEWMTKTVVCHTLDRLLGEKKVLSTTLGSMGVATLMKQEGQYIVHLLYAVPTKRGSNVEIIEDIYPVHSIEVSLAVPERVKRVYLAPQNEPIAFTQQDGILTVKDITISCHQMIVAEF